ncbi:MAG: metal ABC transporter permease [Chlamydiia bacterium]
MNPYWGADFLQTIVLLLKRFFLLILGKMPLESLVEDDIGFLALFFVGISCVFSGTFLVVKRMTLLINSLSHTILLGIVCAGLLLMTQGFSPFSTTGFVIAALLTSFFTIFCTNVLIRVFRVQAEAAVGFMFTTLFALGVLFSTLFFRNTHLGVEAIFGNLDAVTLGDIPALGVVALLNFFWMFLAFGRLRTAIFDPIFSNVVGLKGYLLHGMNHFVLALTIVAGFQSVGVVIIMSFFCLPTLIAKQFSSSLKKIFVIGSAVSWLVALFSVALSRDILTYFHTPVSTGAIASLSLFFLYLGVALTMNIKRVNLKPSC